MTNASASGDHEGEIAALDSIPRPSHPQRDATHFRRIIAAGSVLRLAEVELREAVEGAREAGDSWTVIGAPLGTTQEAAEGRLTQVPERN
jgi:hypothetical protein